MKERIGDALRNAAMRFGAALNLWHKGELHVDQEDDQQGDKDKPKTQEDNDKKGASYWIQKADENSKNLQSWYDSTLPNAEKFLSGQQLSNFKSYVKQLLFAKKPNVDPESDACAKWTAYINGFKEKSIDEFTTAWEDHILKQVEKFSKENQKKLNDAKAEISQYLLDKESAK